MRKSEGAQHMHDHAHVLVVMVEDVDEQLALVGGEDAQGVSNLLVIL